MTDTETVPAPGFRRSKEPSVQEFYRVYPAKPRNEHDYWLATAEALGIEPRPTRTGPGGISEADTRQNAAWTDYEVAASATYAAARAACIPVVEQWDAEDAASANTDVTITITDVDRDDLRRWVEVNWPDPDEATPWSRASNRIRVALEEALA